MNILVATPWAPPRGGGLERYADEMAHRFAARGHHVVMLGHGVTRDETRDGMRRVEVAPSLKLSNTPVSGRIFTVGRRILREASIDIVNVHTPVPGTAELVAWAARRANVPYVVTYHAGELAAPPGPLRAAAAFHRATFERRMLRQAAGRIAVSPFVSEHVFGALSSSTVPPGVDTRRFNADAAPTPGRILFVGALDRAYAWKGLAVLTRAFEQLASEHPSAHLRLVGAGDLEAHYRAWAQREGFAGRVSFAGRISDDALVDEYAAASVVVLPSTSAAESFGMVLAEANACGRPVVGSRIGGIPSFVHDGENGLLAAPGDAPDLARAIGELMRDPTMAQRMGRAGRERVLRDHAWDALCDRTLDILQGAARSRVTATSAHGMRRTTP